MQVIVQVFDCTIPHFTTKSRVDNSEALRFEMTLPVVSDEAVEPLRRFAESGFSLNLEGGKKPSDFQLALHNAYAALCMAYPLTGDCVLVKTFPNEEGL